MAVEKTIPIDGLIERCPFAIEKLVNSHSDKIFNVCMSYVFNQQDAEEITQDVFLACLDSIHKFNGGSSLSTWLYRIAINKSLDFIKFKKRQKRSGFMIPLWTGHKEDGGFEPIEISHPGLLMESQEELTILYKAIHELPDRQRTALTLMKLEGKSQKETAEIMDIQPKAVESLVQRAKKNLRVNISKAKDFL